MKRRGLSAIDAVRVFIAAMLKVLSFAGLTFVMLADAGQHFTSHHIQQAGAANNGFRRTRSTGSVSTLPMMAAFSPYALFA